MADDLADVYKELRELKEQVRVLMSANPLQASSVSQGRVRFIGGLLRVDSGGSVQIVGTLSIDGTTTVTGSFTVTGPWGLEGDGTITGDVTISGNVTSTGIFTQNGPWNLNGVGTIAGNVTQTGDLTVTGGGSITAGLITIDPSTAGGTIGFGGGRRIDAASGYLGIYDGGRFVVFNSSGVSINGGGGPTLTVGPSGIQGVPSIALASAPPGSFVGAVVYDNNNALRRVV